MTTTDTYPRDRLAGVLVAAACGDALGAGYEFGPPMAHDASVSMIGGGPFGFAPGEWTDDTSMAIAIAELVREGADLRDVRVQDRLIVRWLEWAADAKDVGTQTRAVFRATRAAPSAINARKAAKAVHDRTGRSGGNGSLMRTGPVALAYLDQPGALAEAARVISDLTHFDTDAGDACVLWSLAIRHAILFGEFNIRAGLELLPLETRDRWAHLITAAEGRRPQDFTHNGWVVEAFQAAWSAIITTEVPDDNPVNGSYAASHLQLALESAVRGGNDTDTVAAIAGALLGARWGVSAIPLAWQRELHGWPGLRYRDLVELTATPGSTPVELDYSHLRALQAIHVHPYDDGVFMGGVNGAQALTPAVDAAVSLCRVDAEHLPVGVNEPRNHVEVWLVDSGDPDANPHLQFVLDQAAGMVQQFRSERRQVFLHCAAGQSRTPTVAAVYASKSRGTSAADEFAALAKTTPGPFVGQHFVDAIDARNFGSARVSRTPKASPSVPLFSQSTEETEWACAYFVAAGHFKGMDAGWPALIDEHVYVMVFHSSPTSKITDVLYAFGTGPVRAYPLEALARTSVDLVASTELATRTQQARIEAWYRVCDWIEEGGTRHAQLGVLLKEFGSELDFLKWLGVHAEELRW